MPAQIGVPLSGMMTGCVRCCTSPFCCFRCVAVGDAVNKYKKSIIVRCCDYECFLTCDFALND